MLWASITWRMYRNILFINMTGESFIVWALGREGDPEGLKNTSPSLAPGSSHRTMSKAAGFFIFESSSCKWSEALILVEERQQRGGMQSRILILFSASAWLLIQHQSDKKLKKFTIHTTICTVRDDFFCCLFSASSHGQVIWILCVLFSSLRFSPP